MAVNSTVSVAVIGASGFTGEKLVELLLNHPRAEVTYLSAKLDEECAFSDLFPRFTDKTGLICKNLDIEEAADKARVIFLAVPHKISLDVVPQGCFFQQYLY